MLVLTRHVGELISIGDDVWIKVLDVRGNTVRFGIQAPKDVAGGVMLSRTARALCRA